MKHGKGEAHPSALRSRLVADFNQLHRCANASGAFDDAATDRSGAVTQHHRVAYSAAKRAPEVAALVTVEDHHRLAIQPSGRDQ
jgi:hypothetical protein